MIQIVCMAALALAPPETGELNRAIEILERLDGIPLTAEYRNEKLEEVINDLNGHLPIPVRADWRSLERLGVHPDDQVTLRLNPTVASTVLAALVMTIGDEFERPVFEAHAGQMVLTSLQGSAPMRITATYDVRDLLANEELIQQLRDDFTAPDQQPATQPDSAHEPEAKPAPDAAPEPAPQNEPMGPLSRRHGPGGNPNLPIPHFDEQPPTPQQSRPLSPGEQLYMLITDHVDPEAWMNFGGDRARVSDANGVLMITATPSVHRSFRDALDALRRANPSTITIDAAIVDLPRSLYEQLVRQSPPNSAPLAAAIRTASASKILWQTTAGVALGAHLDTESSSEDANVRIALASAMDPKAGVLTLAVEASTKHGADQRRVKTSIALTGDQGAAVIELAPATRSDSVRLLLLIPDRR